MDLIYNNGYNLMQQQETLQALREFTEVIAQQNQNTQLIIVIVLIILIFGFLMFMGLRGGFKIFQQLSDNIKKQNDVEEKRLNEHAKVADALEKQTQVLQKQSDVFNSFFSGYETRVQKVDDMVKVIYENVYYIKENVVYLSEVLANNPQDYKTLIGLLQQLNLASTRAKTETQELEKVKVNEQTP